MLRSIGSVTQLRFGSEYSDPHLKLDPANNSSWASHTKAILWATWGNPKSWAHLATRPFPNSGVFGRLLQDMFDTLDLVPILGHTLVEAGHVPHLPPT